MRKFTDYQEVVGELVINQIVRIAQKLSGKSIKMVNSTAEGGGVAEILNRLIPLLNELGIKTKWEVLKGNTDFFDITKNIHNAIHGKEEIFTVEMKNIFRETNRKNAEGMSFSEDFIFIHDPQPIALVEKRKDSSARWIWRCHIDSSNPYSPVWNFLEEYILKYDASIFSAPSFAKEFPHPQFMISPSIDPLTDKNKSLSPIYINSVLDKYNLDRRRPIISQISRFDRLKDPLGVITAYKIVKKTHDCQLVLAGGTATDDPESVKVLPEILERAKGDPDIHIIELPPFSDLEINALQRGSTIILQKSLKEGFALTVTEGLWKKKPVIASAVGGIPLQIIHNFTGLLVHSIEGTALKIRYLLNNPEFARRLGEQGFEHVRHNFLITRHIRDYLLCLIALDHPDEKIISF